MPTADFWQGKRVLLTGHTGFKGSWLALWLSRLGARVTGIALPPDTTPNLFDMAAIDGCLRSRIHDLRQYQGLPELIREADPEIVLHLAAQPLVLTSYKRPLDTFASNVMGTVHVLDALCELDKVRVVVAVTTDKVYRGNQLREPYSEDDALGGHDPYSASKAAAELAIASYRDSVLASRGVAVASARAGNVMGGGDWSLHRLIPDAIRAWMSGQTLVLRNPEAIRPWQHVLDPLAGYLMLAQSLWSKPDLAGAFNFGPALEDAVPVRTVIDLAQESYGSGARSCGQDHGGGMKEAEWLALNTSKAQALLGFRPRWRLPEAIRRTISWYQQATGGASAAALCEADIEAYLAES